VFKISVIVSGVAPSTKCSPYLAVAQSLTPGNRDRETVTKGPLSSPQWGSVTIAPR